MAETTAGSTHSPSHGRKILVVEDHGDVRDVLRMLLEHEGHQVQTAHDGPSALARARESAPEIVLLDIGLPGRSGYTVARELKALPDCANAFVIAISGYAQAAGRDQNASSGFDLHILKPIDSAKVLELIRDVPPRSSSSR